MRCLIFSVLLALAGCATDGSMIHGAINGMGAWQAWLLIDRPLGYDYQYTLQSPPLYRPFELTYYRNTVYNVTVFNPTRQQICVRLSEPVPYIECSHDEWHYVRVHT